MSSAQSTDAKSNVIVHLCWTIALLLLAGAAILLNVPDGTILRDYISFASAISSIVLAVVAIFYSMISNQSFSETIGSLKSSAGLIDKTEKEINDVSSSLSGKVESILDEFSQIRPAVQEISSKIDQRIPIMNEIVAESAVNSADLKDRKLFKSGPTVGGLAGFHIILKAFETKFGKFNINDIFPDSVIYSNYCIGVVECIKATEPCDLKINRVRKDASVEEKQEEKIYYEVMSLGKYDIKSLRDELQLYEINESSKEIIDKIYEYFAITKE